MNAIDPRILVDVLNGVYGDRTDYFLEWVQEDPRREELLWFLQGLSIGPDGVNGLLNRIRGFAEWGSSLAQTLRFMAGGEFTGHYPSRIGSDETAELFKMMDEASVAAQATLADTKVSRIVLKELDLALVHKVPVPFFSDSRFGKTKLGSVSCQMRIGRRRLVTCAESGRDWDFFASVAKPLGVQFTDRTPAPRIKRAIEHVLQDSGLFLVFDEAHYLIPVKFHKNTPPRLLNWVRGQVIDKGAGCAFFSTSQSYNQSLERYAKTTKYNLEQFLGRVAPAVVLADYYDRDELMAVAKVHFPEFPEKLMALICARAMQAEGYLKSVEHAARYASALAAERKNTTPTLQDVEAAIERMMPAKGTAAGSEAEGTRGKSVAPRSPKSPIIAPDLEDPFRNRPVTPPLITA